jgi:hypothetical protein
VHLTVLPLLNVAVTTEPRNTLIAILVFAGLLVEVGIVLGSHAKMHLVFL